ncbi:MAG: Zinc carboxypeptidase [Candidatus Latescibacteria bacterium ADurb.Bin168]|nr:MAG: Zinc carboxypeptidase [Candidatus Latescibacteria bacterium ADurb.Bin168]
MSVTVDCDFTGGNIVVDAIDGDTVHLRQDLRDTTTDWFYWYFRVGGAAGRALTFQFTKSRALGARGAAMSPDGGRNWRWLGAVPVQGNRFSYTFPDGADEARFSFAMPYLEADWRAFAARMTRHPAFSTGVLCKTRKGREVEFATIDATGGNPTHRVAITCRHHCCEMMVNYTLERLIQWVLESDEDTAEWLRANAAFFIVPFVDKDGSEDGDQGKNRFPRDHGRDYEGESVHAETAAIRKKIPVWADGKLRLALDLHCPWIAGPHNEVIYLVGAEDPRMEGEQRCFSAVLEAENKGMLPFRASDFLPFGTDWNSAKNYTGGKGFTRWAAELRGVRLATAIEIPYANAGGAEVNAESARSFGPDIGAAIARYLQSA